MDLDFDVPTPPTLVTEFINILGRLNIKLVAVVESVFVSCVLVLLILGNTSSMYYLYKQNEYGRDNHCLAYGYKFNV